MSEYVGGGKWRNVGEVMVTVHMYPRGAGAMRSAIGAERAAAPCFSVAKGLQGYSGCIVDPGQPVLVSFCVSALARQQMNSGIAIISQPDTTHSSSSCL